MLAKIIIYGLQNRKKNSQTKVNVFKKNDLKFKINLKQFTEKHLRKANICTSKSKVSKS